MTEICDNLSSEKDWVVYLLASLPGTYNTLVTALEASAEVPTLTVVKNVCYMKRQKWRVDQINSFKKGY